MNGLNQAVDALLTDVAGIYGYDFSGYARRYLVDRIFALYRKSGCAGFDAFAQTVLADQRAFDLLCQQLMISYSEMFRDPPFFTNIRSNLVPYLRSFPSLRVWHAGCGRGEEVYSLAILLLEEGLYERCTVFATDLLEASIDAAKAGRYDALMLDSYAANYRLSGGRGALDDYVTVKRGQFTVDASLAKNIHFFTHNLLADQVFGQMNLVLCRNVCIYLNEDNRWRVIRLLTDSLVPGGFLGMGSSEYPDESDRIAGYRPYGGNTSNLFQKWVRPKLVTLTEEGNDEPRCSQ